MSGKLTEAERIEWRVWYFLPFAKMDELPRGCAFPRSVSQAVVEIIINGALRNRAGLLQEPKSRGPLVPLAMQCVT
jgi:hypothetical protein